MDNIGILFIKLPKNKFNNNNIILIIINLYILGRTIEYDFIE